MKHGIVQSNLSAGPHQPELLGLWLQIVMAWESVACSLTKSFPGIGPEVTWQTAVGSHVF